MTSWPGTIGSAGFARMPSTAIVSEWQTPHASTRSRT
jgi:hypothetical protein